MPQVLVLNELVDAVCMTKDDDVVQGRITGVPPNARVPDDDEPSAADRAAAMDESVEYDYDVPFTNDDGTEVSSELR